MVVLNAIKHVVKTKIKLWILGLLTSTAGLVLVGVFLLFIIIMAAVSGGTSQNQSTSNSSVGGGKAYCSTTGELNEEMWNNVWNDENQVGVMKGHDDLVLSYSQELGVDPVLVTSIMQHESAKGHSNAIRNKNNPGGIMDWNNNWKTLYHFPTLEDGIKYSIENIARRILKEGLVTLEDLGNRYAPIGAANDPHGLNKNWIPLVSQYANNLGGLTMNCEVGGNFDFTFDGDVSELRQNVAKVGEKWLGRPYFWGGGRNPASVARGEFDCSSFVHWAYAQNGIDLGNMGSVSTETLKHLGTKISINDMKVGDLIFWDTYKIDGHVAIYIGNGKFIGSQGSTGVSIVDVNDSYWQKAFRGHVRRIIQD